MGARSPGAKDWWHKEGELLQTHELLLFRKGSLRARAKQRFEHCPFVQVCLFRDLALTGLSEAN